MMHDSRCELFDGLVGQHAHMRNGPGFRFLSQTSRNTAIELRCTARIVVLPGNNSKGLRREHLAHEHQAILVREQL
jgi:hypothetical protein